MPPTDQYSPKAALQKGHGHGMRMFYGVMIEALAFACLAGLLCGGRVLEEDEIESWPAGAQASPAGARRVTVTADPGPLLAGRLCGHSVEIICVENNISRLFSHIRSLVSIAIVMRDIVRFTAPPRSQHSRST